MSKLQKLLVCGDVLGEFDQLFKRVRTVNQKAGPFDLLLCTGDFFAEGANPQWLPYKKGTVKVPMLTFVLGPTHPGQEEHFPSPLGGELAENVVYLGPTGIYPCNSGLRIAYLSGCEKLAGLKLGYTNFQVGQLEAKARQLGVIDVLIARPWPSNVTTYAGKPADTPDPDGCPLVARLAHSVKPRYHFAASLPLYYDRLPYRNHQVLQEPARQCSRFLGLAAVGNSAKSKWLYAFTLTPAQHCTPQELSLQPSDVTESPYAAVAMPPITQEESQINPFFYGGAKELRGQKREGDKQGGAREKRLPPTPTGPCWFCLSSPEVEKHLIVSVGEYTYLSLAKGGLVPHHLMIMPINHYQTSLDLEKQATDELSRFKRGLRDLFASSGRCVVFYERNYRTTHMQLHAVPLPDQLAPAVATVFKEQAESQGLELEEVPRRTELSAAVSAGQPYLLVEPPHGNSLLCRVKKGYNMRFDREVLASEDLLNLPDRVDWKNCKASTEHETQLRDDVRKLFKPFDFTVDSDDDGGSSSSSSEEED